MRIRTSQTSAKDLLLGKDLNLSAIADRSGIPSSTVRGWKRNGISGMSLLHFARWTKARGLTGEEVMQTLELLRKETRA